MNDNAFELLDQCLFYSGNEVDTLIVPLMRELEMNEQRAKHIVKEWAEKRDYTICKIDVVLSKVNARPE